MMLGLCGVLSIIPASIFFSLVSMSGELVTKTKLRKNWMILAAVIVLCALAGFMHETGVPQVVIWIPVLALPPIRLVALLISTRGSSLTTDQRLYRACLMIASSPVVLMAMFAIAWIAVPRR
jgi:hypothetical protein